MEAYQPDPSSHQKAKRLLLKVRSYTRTPLSASKSEWTMARAFRPTTGCGLHVPTLLQHVGAGINTTDDCESVTLTNNPSEQLCEPMTSGLNNQSPLCKVALAFLPSIWGRMISERLVAPPRANKTLPTWTAKVNGDTIRP